MPWIEVTAPYDHVFTATRAMKRYEPGRHNVPREVAKRAVAKGKAKPSKRPESEKLADGAG